MPVSAKICGLSTPDTVDAAIRHGAAYLGFVFFPKSPRDIAPERAGGFGSPAHVGRVGVFVDPEEDLLAYAVRAARLSAVQLHGAETPARVAALRQRLGVPVWKAVAVRTRADLDAGRAYRGAADRLLYDAKPPPGADLPGGLGLRFDWSLLDGFDHPLPWLLSGGLDAASVGDAVGISGARLLDISSGVERAPGVKDVDKIATFLQATARL
ncbi:phosphoribosylanthranilate isomerase [Sphingomonas morindae]|uniref:N-(5'-phosphoribosyl)anthranilate isomerase n=1 Tax=Sphingomonas morindae TaxID=1541170 RepID=A0ABY4X5P7_9SPHN|nr:phosphoribosylanthranilate isomerase [Sphingomonas morindae]USI72185.1 phosphoribosylanthranilate isomerase [Sphingomonas morindae]